jgi:hypothetical protein
VIEYFTFRSSDPVNRREEYAIITGGNRGLGFYTLLGLQVSGMKVIAGTKSGFLLNLLSKCTSFQTLLTYRLPGWKKQTTTI